MAESRSVSAAGGAACPPGGGSDQGVAADAGAVGLINVDDPGFTIEPARWPEAYACSILDRRASAPPVAPKLAVMRLSADALATVIEGSSQKADDILAAGRRLAPAADLRHPGATAGALMKSSQHEFFSDNVLGMLPGTNPKLAPEVVVVSAHLDGYGHGEPVGGDDLYNGAFDDAAYVAALVRLAESRHGKGFRRSVLFAAFTGEEKGLLGATWFTPASHGRQGEPRRRHQSRPVAAAVPAENPGPCTRSTTSTLGDTRSQRRQANGHRNPRGPGAGSATSIHAPTTTPSCRSACRRPASSSAMIRARRPSGVIASGIRSRLSTACRTTWTQPIDASRRRPTSNTFFYRLTAAVADADARPSLFAGKSVQTALKGRWCYSAFRSDKTEPTRRKNNPTDLSRSCSLSRPTESEPSGSMRPVVAIGGVCDLKGGLRKRYQVSCRFGWGLQRRGCGDENARREKPTGLKLQLRRDSG